MELSSCPQCTTRRNIPISFSFFLTNRFHLVLSCKHCNVRYVPTMLQRIVQLILMLALSICCGLLYTPALRLELALSKVGTFRLLPFWVLVLLLMLTLAHWLPLRMQVEFRDDAAYQAESGRIMRFTGEPADEVTVIWLKGSLEELAAYLDGEPQDGTRYVLACVQLDPVQKTVSYFAAQLYDGQKPLSAVSDILHDLRLNT